MNVATNILIAAILIYKFNLAFWWWIILIIAFILDVSTVHADNVNSKKTVDFLAEIKYLLNKMNEK